MSTVHKRQRLGSPLHWIITGIMGFYAFFVSVAGLVTETEKLRPLIELFVSLLLLGLAVVFFIENRHEKKHLPLLEKEDEEYRATHQQKQLQ